MGDLADSLVLSSREAVLRSAFAEAVREATDVSDQALHQSQYGQVMQGVKLAAIGYRTINSVMPEKPI
jgi:hypothetical protein